MTGPVHLSITRRVALAALAGIASMSAQAQQEPIRIGFTGPLSGSLSLLGNGVRDGLLTYISHVNSQGGVNGRKIELIAEDDGYDPTRTLAAAKKLVEQDRIVAFVSPTGTPNVAALIPYATESRVPILFPYAFSNTLTTPVKKYVFTTLPEVRVQANVLGDYLLNEVKHQKIAAIYQNDDFGQDAVAGLEARLKAANVPITKLPFDRGSTNFSGVVAQARQADAQSVVFLGIPRDAALVMKEANKMGWKPQFSGHNALGDPQTFALAGAGLVEGSIAVAVMEPLDSSKPQLAEFAANQKKFLPRTNPTTYSLHGYNAGQIFVEALKRIKGEVTGDAVVAAVEGIKDFDTGLMAPVTFSKDQHAGSLSVAFLRAKDAKWQMASGWMKAK